MFNQPLYITHSFSIFFPRQIDICRRAFDLESLLGDQYGVPHVITVPDELDPETPRIVISSKHGFSQLQVSQISLAMHVRYSPDFQRDSSRIRAYLRERIPPLFDILKNLSIAPAFCGLSAVVRISSQRNEHEIMKALVRALEEPVSRSDLYDLEIKTTSVADNRFFSNVAVSNYREWSSHEDAVQLIPFSRNTSTSQGVHLVGDFNDRFSYNEQSDYHSNSDVVQPLIELCFSTLEELSATIIQINEV